MKAIKTYFCLALMIGLIVMALITKDVINSKLFASLGIITGAFVPSNLSDNSRNSKVDK
ncbi:hypothetical protein [Runella sp.]|jgi:hypothetical protein|uniref:hypothetical protein n=1 Tax=Runella sp. TaxID=1960881 RepID=UPI002632F7FF|nr:hypothetical protein [Runella sp.]